MGDCELAIIEFGFRIIWRIMEIEADNSLLDFHNYSDDTKAEFNNFLLFIQNNSWFKNKLKYAYLHRC